MWFWLLCVATAAVFSAEAAGAGAARLVCYVESARASDFTECTHLVYTGDARGDKLDTLLKEYRKNNPKLKIVIRVSDNDKDLRSLLKSKHVQGLEIHDAHRTLNNTKVLDMVDGAKAAISSSGGGPLFLALPAHPELLAKYYDLRNLVKKTDLMMVQTHALGIVKKMTYHPSRLSGMWDMMNTDSVVDLVIGLGVPASKLVISLPATARQFRLENETLSTPGSPTVEDEPKVIDQGELCRQLRQGRWTLERDQDLSAPYAFKDKTWISFEDASSVDVKGKYARVRGLAGLALHNADRDAETPCGPTLKASLNKVLNQQSRAPRAAVLRSLENEILSAPIHARALDALQVSPYRISQVVDSDGVIHSIREDTRTEFSCSRQGYFVHPRSCARFYRCVKFDQLSPDYTVFEFDCPAGLAFDSRYEVCVWPGSLAHSQACPGSSEIAPVPRTRFLCPEHEGYYADPENCRWFFACLDHGTAPLTAYEFRCPFGLGFDAARLKCDWPWVVPACGNIARYEAEAYVFSAATLTGAAGFRGQTADSVNIAAHQSLISGASLDNLVGIQNGFLTHADALDANFISSQEYSPEASGQIFRTETTAPGFSTSGITYNIEDDSSNINPGFVQASKYNDNEYTSGSLILDDYRVPAGSSISNRVTSASGQYNEGNTAKSEANSRTTPRVRYQTGKYVKDNSGRYVHNPAGDHALPYNHVDSIVLPYLHDADKYKHSGTFDVGRYAGFHTGYSYPKPSKPFEDGIAYTGKGGYTDSGSGAHVDHSSTNDGFQFGFSNLSPLGNTGESLYKLDGMVGSYKDRGNSGINVQQYNTYNNAGRGTYVTGSKDSLYKLDGVVGGYPDGSNFGLNVPKYNSYSNAGVGTYLTDSKVYTGGSHTLTAGAINVGLVGKTSLVDYEYTDQGNYQTGHEIVHENVPAAHVNYISQPAVSISHVGTGPHHIDGYSYVTNPTSSGVPTTAIPFAVTTSLPAITYRTTYVPLAPKTSVKQLFGYTQPAVTYVQPAVVPVKQQYVTPRVEVIDHSQGSNYQYETRDYTASTKGTQSTGYRYSQPSIKFEDGVAYSTPTPAVSIATFQPRGFSHSQQTHHAVQSGGYEYSNPTPVTEAPFRKVVAYTTGPPVSTYVQPTEATYTPQSFSHQTLHTVDTSKLTTYSQDDSATGYEYSQPKTQLQEHNSGYQYSTAAPVVTSTYRTPSYSHQTIHKVEAQNIVPSSTPLAITRNEYSYPTTPVTLYENPILKYTQKVTPATYVSPAQSYSQQTIHHGTSQAEDIGSIGYEYTKSNVGYEQPKIVQYTTPLPAISSQPAVSTYEPQTYSQQTIHKVDASRINTYTQDSESGYTYSKPAVKFETASVIETSSPTPVVSTYTPHAFSQQTFHKVNTQKYIPVSSTPSPTADVVYQQPEVTVYENPIIKYTQNVTPAPHVRPTASVFTQSYKSVSPKVTSSIQYPSTIQESYIQSNQEGYTYEQPEIQRNHGVPKAATYSDASAVSHQVFHQTHDRSQSNAGKEVVFVSTTPSTLVYENHYTEYESPKIVETYKASEYIPPKTEYQQTYTVSTASTPVVYQQSSVTHETQDYEHKPVYTKKYEAPDKVESIHFSSFSQSPEIQIGYKAEEYLPPISSTARPVTSTYRPRYLTTSRGYLPPVKNTYLPPAENTYLPPISKNTYLPPISPTPESIEYLPSVQNTGSSSVVNFESFGYENKAETLGYNPYQDNTQTYFAEVSSTAAPVQRKQNIVVETAKSNFLGFGTVGPDAGLVSPVSYTTASPIIVPTTDNSYLPPKLVTTTYAPEIVEISSPAARRARPKYGKPFAKSTTQEPVYFQSTTYAAPDYLPPSTTTYKAPDYLPPITTTYKAPDYLPPATTTYKAPDYLPPAQETDQPDYKKYQVFNSDDSLITTTAPTYQRKQNIVVETAKSHLLGFETVGADAGLVSTATYTTATPIESYRSTYAPVKQGTVELYPARFSSRRNKPQVAVVTKINDFNPLLVRKLGAVCSCQSPVLVLKGKKPSVQSQQDLSDYSIGYDDSNRGDLSGDPWSHESTKFTVAGTVVTPTPIVTSTLNPIIVPDDSYYQDYQESTNDNVEIISNGETYVSSTPVFSTTQKSVRIRPQVKAVTLAPSYKTVLLNQDVTPTTIVEITKSPVSSYSQSFDRFGPGGWRSRDETLQGSVDCKRAGLFRHPKQCNKFYACRWDCSKQRFTLHIFNCPVQLSFDPNLGACNWPSQGPACQGDTLLTNTL